jgi:hypothetical protein
MGDGAVWPRGDRRPHVHKVNKHCPSEKVKRDKIDTMYENIYEISSKEKVNGIKKKNHYKNRNKLI